MNPSHGRAIEAARAVLLERLQRLLPGAGTLSVEPVVVDLNDVVIYTCRRSNRGAAVNLWVTVDGDPQALSDRVIAELEATQVCALEAPRP